MNEVILLLDKKDLPHLGAIRVDADIKAATSRDELWVRGIFLEDTLPPEIQQLPALSTFLLDEKERLFPIGKNTPVGRLKLLDWSPLQTLLQLESPVFLLPGQTSEKTPLRLVPATTTHKASALLCNWVTFFNYASTAPQIRLAQLRFARCSNGQCLLLGTPLPPLPGKNHWNNKQLVLPAGYDFELSIYADLFLQKQSNVESETYLFSFDGSFVRLHLSDFLPATRAAIRASNEEDQP